MKPVYVATDYHEKQLQRALLQFNRPQNAPLVREALRRAGRTDLIGFGGDCLVRPESGADRRAEQYSPTPHTGKRNNKPVRTAPQKAPRNAPKKSPSQSPQKQKSKPSPKTKRAR